MARLRWLAAIVFVVFCVSALEAGAPQKGKLVANQTRE